jgi:ribosomal protein S18 acetylase RimI-like enzyme
MIEFIIAKNNTDLLMIEKLANKIWHEHFVPIIGVAQVEYMLNKYQKVKNMQDQLKNGFLYYRIYYQTQAVGYMSFKKEKEGVFLSKIYVLSNFRGKKIGKSAISFVENRTREFGLSRISLTVNKDNRKTIEAYKKLGFKKTGSIVKDIGNGFIMDDYKMEKVLDG